MESTSTPYEDVVSIYRGLVRQDSPQAAAAIEQIQAVIGTRAALHAALIMTIFRMELKQNHWIPDVSVYTHLLWNYPEALPLLEYALGCCLQAWGIHNLELVHLKISEPANPAAKAHTVARH